MRVIYTLTLCFEERRAVCSAFGLQGVLDTIPQLEPDLYFVNRDGVTIGTAARHPSGHWHLSLDDGREFGGHAGEPGPILARPHHHLNGRDTTCD